MPEPRDWLLVSETFKTVQGEGPSAGVPAFFIRLGGCNQHCTDCDSGYTWIYDERHQAMHSSGKIYDPAKELKRMSFFELTDQVFRADCRLVVITGGEPLLQLDAVSKLITECNAYPRRTFRFEIETAGSIDPGDLVDIENVTFNVSPKLEHTGNELELRFRPDVLMVLASAPRAIFKFWVTNDTTQNQLDQIEEIEHIVRVAGLSVNRLWLMPGGTTTAEIENGLQFWTPWAVHRGWNITSRLQILAFGDTRGT